MRSRMHRTWAVWGLIHEKPHTQDMGSVGVNTREAAYTGHGQCGG